MIALGEEYTYRYNKNHLTIIKCEKPLNCYPPGIPEGIFEEPPQCMPEEYQGKDCVEAYQRYYEMKRELLG